MYIYIVRKLEKLLIDHCTEDTPKGVIVSGIVGCGKTTLITHVLKHLEERFEIFQFSGDDLLFRNNVRTDTTYIEKTVVSSTTKRALVFVDEVQKCEEVFDAIKYAYDNSSTSFIISGSNPDFLNTVAKKRLQRRASFFHLSPFSMCEILAHQNIVDFETSSLFYEILLDPSKLACLKSLELSLSRKITTVVNKYLVYGGIPLAWLAKKDLGKLEVIKNVTERGFESFVHDNQNIADEVKVELATLHSKEFTYKGVMQRTGVRKRDHINENIDQLVNHGYIVKKQPFFFDDRRSYLSIFSYIDPGIVSFLTGNTEISDNIGFKAEGYVHARLMEFCRNYPLKLNLYYYKPYTIDHNDNVKFKQGEIDFIFQKGDLLIPIEVKFTNSITNISVPLLKNFIQSNRIKLGIVIYGGVPYLDKKSKILYWPYWLL